MTKRLTDLTSYDGVLPYASELFGVYQPLIGWKSKRMVDRARQGLRLPWLGALNRLGRYFNVAGDITVNSDCVVDAQRYSSATFTEAKLVDQQLRLMNEVRNKLVERKAPPNGDEWRHLLQRGLLDSMLTERVLPYYQQLSVRRCAQIAASQRGIEAVDPRWHSLIAMRAQNESDIRRQLVQEATVAGILASLADAGNVPALNSLFYQGLERRAREDFVQAMKQLDNTFDDPYLTFDPKKDIGNVSISPLGIVHLYRQFFFELDTFLGSPVGHVWLSPGSTVELVEVSTRRTTTERSVEVEMGTTTRTEKILTTTDEISEAVKEDNKNDLKLGITSTVNQSWGTGNASATASLDMDKTQQVGREQTHKRSREQTEKFSTEIRQNYKSTFKTVTEQTDTSSKRYVLTNPSDKPLMNYELRRKMRQVAVQVQDVGSYLCWETFVDEPGNDLGLASLVHIAQVADLLPVPDQSLAPYPPDIIVPFQANLVWNFDDARQYGFVPLNGNFDVPGVPQGYEIVREPGIIAMAQISANGEDFSGTWGFGARFTPTGQLEIGVITASDGLEWDERVDFVVGGAVRCTPTDAKKQEIDAGNNAKIAAAGAATAENERRTRETFVKGAKERIEMASGIAKRRYEDLREEERIIVYRRLIQSLMTSHQYQTAGNEARHILSELINSIFDVDKMLYFVAPEWWKPRAHAKPYLTLQDLQGRMDDAALKWPDDQIRKDNYLITDKSQPAPLGASLGWLLQLDGDDFRNAFLNAPWVKAVIPVRPGKEQAAMRWLQNVSVEGADGLNDEYKGGTPDEIDHIRQKKGLPAGALVTIGDALDVLCQDVADKHTESNQAKKYPTSAEINDDNKVSSTPVEKVYEHGFFPLKGGFRLTPGESDDPTDKDRFFQVFDQWLEILPTDQVVPVPVEYDPITGRQKKLATGPS